MIKVALQAILTYVMSAYLLPKSTMEEFQGMLNSYWWGANSKGIKWMK